jgi:hypothetical protein
MKTTIMIEVTMDIPWGDEPLASWSQKICDFLVGADGDGIDINDSYGRPAKAEIDEIKIKKWDESFWGCSVGYSKK